VKLATPPDTVAVVPPGLVQVRVELPGLEPRAKATVVVLSPISTLPSASSTDTPTGKLAPAAELAGGWTVNASFVAVPGLFVREKVTTLVPGAVALTT
jgi:hypothetical protein